MKKKMKYIIYALILLMPTVVFAKANCDDFFNGKFGSYLSDALNLIRFASPIVLIGFTIKDFIGALASQNGDELKKAISTFEKRAVIGVLIFFLPTLINFVLNLIGINSTCRL